MVKLHEIVVVHVAPKDRCRAIEMYVIANNEDEVYEKINELKAGSWKEQEEVEEFNICNENFEIIGKETFKQKMMRLRGDANDPDVDCGDPYYGFTMYSWNEGKQITEEEIKIISKLIKVEDCRLYK